MNKNAQSLFNHEKGGKKNKLKIGDKVRATSAWVDWHADHIAWLLATPNGNGEREINLRTVPQVYFICSAKLQEKRPIGIVDHYGSRDNDENIDRKNVHVTFTLKTELGNIQYRCFVNEKDVDVVKKPKSKRL